MYSKEVMKHFQHPKNMGKMERPDGVGRVGNPVCGDVMWLYIKVKKAGGKEIIKDIKFQTFGCAAAIATSSMITELAKNKTIDEALKITKADVSEKLGKLPPIKEHCSLLAVDALNEAIYDYLSKQNKPIPKALEENHKRITEETKHAERIRH